VSEREQYARQAEAWTERSYADARAYLAHRADLVVSLGSPLEQRDEVLDLACGDGGLGPHLLARGLRYRGVDAESAMVAAAAQLLASARDSDNACVESTQALSRLTREPSVSSSIASWKK